MARFGQFEFDLARRVFDEISLVVWYGIAAREVLATDKDARDHALKFLEGFKRLHPDLWSKIQADLDSPAVTITPATGKGV